MISKISRRGFVAGGVGMAGAFAMPAIVRAQSGNPIKIGHLAPRTGPGAILGEWMFRGAELAVESINKAGGVLGQPLELIHEDSVNAATAAAKAQRMIERDAVDMLCGEAITPYALAISEVAARNKVIYLQTGANANDLRGRHCNKYLFHVEAMNSIYVNAIGTRLEQEGRVQGKSWYSLTADYSHGIDLRDASRRFLDQQGGTYVGDELVPLDATDFSAYLLKIRQARPDVVVSNLAAGQVPNFLKQFAEYGLDIPLIGFDMVMILTWAAGSDGFGGVWPCRWHYELKNESSRKFVKDFSAKYKTKPEDLAWGDHVAVNLLAQAMRETNSVTSDDLVAFFETEKELDILKDRPGYFRAWDHQLIQEMYSMTKKPDGTFDKAEDMLAFGEAVPGPGGDLEAMAATRQENPCSL